MIDQTTVTITRLGPGGMARMRALNAVFGQAFDDPQTYQPDMPPDHILLRRLAMAPVIVLVAERDDQVIGGLVAYDLPKLEADRSEIYLYDLAVAAPFRRQGVATALIERLRQIADQLGAWVVFVQADLTDPPAIALYDKLGAREEVLHFDLSPLSRDGSAE